MKNRNALLHTLVLFFILVGGIVTFWMAQGNSGLQMTVGIMTAAAYVFWGIIHHMLAGDLHRKVVIEYVLVGAIAVVLLMTLAL